VNMMFASHAYDITRHAQSALAKAAQPLCLLLQDLHQHRLSSCGAWPRATGNLTGVLVCLCVPALQQHHLTSTTTRERSAVAGPGGQLDEEESASRAAA